MDALNGKRLVILGMARQGTSLARFAVGAGAFVTLSDMRSPAALAEARAEQAARVFAAGRGAAGRVGR